MGSGGKSGNVFDWAINPLNIVGMGEYDPLATMTSQSWKNTWNAATGKEQFAAHDNWFGHGFVGDFLNPIMGGRSDAMRAEDARVDGLWDNYYSDRFSPKNPATQDTSVDKKPTTSHPPTAAPEKRRPHKKNKEYASLLDEEQK